MATPSAALARSQRLLFCATLAAWLAGCAGGGSGEAPAPAPPAAATQGFWSGRIDSQTTASAVYLAEGPTFTVLQSGPQTTLVVANATAAGSSFSLAGRSYQLGSGSVASYSASGTVQPKASLGFAAAGSTPAYSLSYNPAYEVPARLADVAGQWQAAFFGGSLTLGLSFSATGTVSGSSSSGCTYTGSLAPHAGGVAVFDLQLIESCPSAAAQTLNGIATLNTAKTVLSAALEASSLTGAVAFQASR